MSRAENAYWRKKLPPGFRYMLEKIGRGVCKGRPKPANVVEYIATYLEFKQSEHAAEMAALPEVSYVQKLLAKKKRKEAGNISTEQEGASIRAEPIQASTAAAAGAISAAAVPAKELSGAESKKEVDTRTSENVLVKKPAPSGDDKRQSATNLPQAQKSVLEILYPNTSTGKITAENKKGQIHGDSHTSREEIRKQTSKPIQIERQRTSDQYLRETFKGSEQQIAESRSIIKTLSEPAVKSLSQPIVKVPSETSAPLAPNDKVPSQLIVKNPSTAVTFQSKSAVKDQSHSLFPQTFIEPSAGREEEEQAGAAVALIDAQQEVARVSHQQTAELIPAIKSPSQPTVKVQSDAQAPIVKASEQTFVKSPSQLVVKVSSQSAVKASSHSVVPETHVDPPADTDQEEPDKERIAQIHAPEIVAPVSQQQIAELIPSVKTPSQVTVQFRSESYSQQTPIENAASQLVVQAPSKVIVKSPSQPTINFPSQTTVLVSTHSFAPHSHIELSTGREQESPADKTVIQTEPDRAVSRLSQEQIVESVVANKSLSHVPSQQITKVQFEPLIKAPQLSITVPSQLAVTSSSQSVGEASQAAVNIPSQISATQEPVEPSSGRELDEPAEEEVLKAEVRWEIVQVSNQQLAESIQTERAPSQLIVDAVSQTIIQSPSHQAVKASTQEIVKVPSLSAVNVASHSVVKAPSQPTVKATSQLIAKLSQPDVKVSSQSVASRPPVESAEDFEEPAEETVIRTEVLKGIAQVSHQPVAESVPTVKTSSQQVVSALSQPVIKVPSQPAVKPSSQQIVKASSHSVVKASSQPNIKAPSQTAVKTSHATVKVPSQSVAPQAPVNPPAGREPDEAAIETTITADLQRKVAQVSQQQIAESTSKTPLQPVVKVLSQPVVKQPSRPSAKASSQQIVKAPSHSVVKGPSQPIVKTPSQPAVKTSHPTVKVSSQRIAARASIERTTDRELEELAKEVVLQADNQREFTQVSQRQITESIPSTKVASQQVVKTLSHPVVKSPSRPTVKASSQHIVKVPSLPTVKVVSHSVVKTPSQPTVKASTQSTVKVPSQQLESTAGRKMDEPSKETVTRIEVQKEIAQVSQQQIAESMPGGTVPSRLVIKAGSEPALDVPSQSTVKVPSQLIASLEPIELSAGERQVDETITQTEESLRTDIAGQPIEETKPLDETEAECIQKAEEIGESSLDHQVIISTQDSVTVAKTPAYETKAESGLVQTPAETVEDIGIPEVTQTGDEGTKEFDTENDLTFEAETVSSLVAIKAEAEIEKEPVHIEFDREEQKESVIDGDAPVDEHQATALRGQVHEIEINVSQALAEGTERETSLQKPKASVPHLSFDETIASVQDTQSNEPEITPTLVPLDDIHSAASAYAYESEIPISHATAQDDSVCLQEAPIVEPKNSSQLSPEEVYAPLEKNSACDHTEQSKTTGAFVKESETASLKSSAEELKEELSETSKVVVCHRRLSIEPNTIETEGQAEVSETYNATVCQRSLSADPTTKEVEDQVEVCEASKEAVRPRRLSIDQTTTGVEGEVEVSETSKDSVCQRMLPLKAEIQDDASETCVVDVCQRRLSVKTANTETEAEANVSEDPCNAAVCQTKLSKESANTEAETRAEVSETPSTEPELQVPCPPTEELMAQAEISEIPGDESSVPREEPEGYVSNVPPENMQGYIQETFPQESELPASYASLEESSTAQMLETSSQEHESLGYNEPSNELQTPAMKLCTNDPEAFTPSEEPLSIDLKVPSEEPQVSSEASEPPANANEAEAPIQSAEI